MNKQTKMHQDMLLQVFLMGLDIAAIWLAFSLAYWIRFEAHIIPVTKGLPNFWDYFRASIFTIIICETLLIYNGLYKIRGKDFSYNIVYRIACSTIIGTMILMAFIFIFRNLNLSRWVVFLWLIFNNIFLNLSRWAFYNIIKHIRKNGWSVYRTLIIGTGKMAKTIAEKIQNHPESGMAFVGYIADPTTDENNHVNGDIIGSIYELDKIIVNNSIDKVIIACPQLDRNLIFELLLHIDKNIADFSLAPDMLEMMINRVIVDDIYGIPLLSLKETPLKGWKLFVKYSFDRLAAFAGLILLSPLFLIIAIMIKLDSKGPVFYKQDRIGADGKHFLIYKFRSMRNDAEELTGPVWAKQDDPRKTRIGAFLRSHNLDELPQLFNVLKGDMSLVGPRPERPFFVSKFKEKIPLYMSRHRVKSGITGWAQVNGLRGDTSIEERTKYDIYYVENWTFLFDIKILLMTFFSRENAY
jgi:exopolysaccharide biosynthesis polyprenyl glycosylphosphotransferase